MPGWSTYRDLQVPSDLPSGEVGIALKDDFMQLADRNSKSNYSVTTSPTVDDVTADCYRDSV